MILLLGRICWNAIRLNKEKNIDVWLCFHGNTNCINVTVEENGSLVYTNREFSNNEQGLSRMLADIQKMYKVAKTYE